MANLNELTLIGYVGREPYMDQGDGYVRATLPVATTYKRMGNQEKTIWHNVTLFAKQAIFAQQYIKKGDLVFVRAMLDYYPKEVGDKTYNLPSITGYNIQILSSKNRQEQSVRPSQQMAQPVQQARQEQPIQAPKAVQQEIATDNGVDDLPF